MSRDEQIHQAFLAGDIEKSKILHNLNAIHAPENHVKAGAYIKSAVYGGLDGILTTPALIASCLFFPEAQKSMDIIALAAIISDALAMSLGDYITTKSENEYIRFERMREGWEVENFPDGEKKEMIEIYKRRGMNDADANLMVMTMSKNKEAWIDIMMKEELGLFDNMQSPLKHAIVTFSSFGLFGLLPIIPQFLQKKFNFEMNMIPFSMAVASLAIFFLGAAKTKITRKNWIISGIEAFIMGVIVVGTSFTVSAACYFMFQKHINNQSQ